MTSEDIAQITAIVAAVEQRLTARQERAIEAIGNDFSALHQEFKALLQPIVARLDTLDRRTERTEININSILMQLSGISRSLTVGEQLGSQMAATQGAQQQAIDQLAQRITKIERELHPEQH